MAARGAYSDVVFRLFRLLGYRFGPRLADIGGMRFWRVDASADYGKLDLTSRHGLGLQRIALQWDDMLRLAGSLDSDGRHHPCVAHRRQPDPAGASGRGNPSPAQPWRRPAQPRPFSRASAASWVGVTGRQE
jgi:hypothetical protein